MNKQFIAESNMQLVDDRENASSLVELAGEDTTTHRLEYYFCEVQAHNTEWIILNTNLSMQDVNSRRRG